MPTTATWMKWMVRKLALVAAKRSLPVPLKNQKRDVRLENR